VKGTPNKATAMREQILVQATAIAESLSERRHMGIDTTDPFEVALAIMHMRFAAGDQSGALVAAGILLPYCRPKLVAQQIQVQHTYVELSDAELAEQRAVIEAKLASVIEEQAESVA
jgi:hypothetical protein